MIDALISVFGAGRIGIKVSPRNIYNIYLVGRYND